MTVRIAIRVVPGAKRQQFKWKDAKLVCYVTSRPEKGRANKELIEVLATLWKLPRQAITIVSGETSRHKMLEVNTSSTLPHLLMLLSVELDIS